MRDGTLPCYVTSVESTRRPGHDRLTVGNRISTDHAVNMRVCVYVSSKCVRACAACVDVRNCVKLINVRARH